MCGIVGFIRRSGAHIGNLEKAMGDMLILDTIRGEDSTGVMCAYKRFEGTRHIVYNAWAKEEVEGSTFVKYNKDYADLWKFPGNVMFMIGHNRAATRGAVNLANAHPFVEGKIQLVHNGSLLSHSNLGGGRKFDVDSNAIAAEIDLNGIDELVKKMNGAASLIWHNTEERTLNLYRNSQRPMHIIETKDALFFSSELGIAIAALSRNGIKIIDSKETPVNTLITIDYDAHQQTIGELKLREINPPPVVVHSYSDWKPRRHWEEYEREWEAESKRTIPQTKKVTLEPLLGMTDICVWSDKFPALAVDPVFETGHTIMFCYDSHIAYTGDAKKDRVWIEGTMMLDKHKHIDIQGEATLVALQTTFKNKTMLAGRISSVTVLHDGVYVVIDGLMAMTGVADPFFEVSYDKLDPNKYHVKEETKNEASVPSTSLQ